MNLTTAPAVADGPCGGEGAPASADDVFDALVRPHQSLSDGGFRIFIALVLTVSVATQLLCLAGGIWPAGSACLCNGIFLAAAMIALRRDRERTERIILAAGEVSISRHSRSRLITHDRLQAWGLAIERHVDPDYGCRSLTLRHRGRRVEIARDLSPAERQSLFEALYLALRRAGFDTRVETRTLPALSSS
jgi:uncharacterized membrane protein